MASRRVGVGVVGAGVAARRQFLGPLTGRTPAGPVAVVAICDLVPERSRELAAAYGIPRAHSSIEDLLEDPRVELVALLTPIQTHYELAMRCISAGKHTFVQKPMAGSVAEATSLIDAAKRAGVKIAAAPGRLLEADHQVALEIIHSGELGRVCFGKARASHPGHERQFTFGIDPSWYYQSGAGPLADVGVYELHSLTSLLGPVRRVTALSSRVQPERIWKETGRPIAVEVEDCVLVTLEFDRGVLAQLDATYCMPACELPARELYLTDGVLLMGGWWQPDRPIQVFKYEPAYGHSARWVIPVTPNWSTPPRSDPGIAADVIELANAVIEEREPRNSAAQARHCIEIIEKATKAATTGVAQVVESTF